ncbi:nuclear protein Es2-domain-containing protein [Endogone sp. FLAS-F59071]|nr:nuclear protein Es2-domain-containing protein [Endogone sp. FLAS-F59071]|eukprot:RUS14412.1 nuclear protein Es2-domain-containing protein [Endogone sp. FLAS-F59071]
MAESSKTPVQSNQRRLQILDEDTYTEAISHIIERDFFPNLTKLKAQQQYLEAYENGDLLSLQSATRALAELAQTPLSGSPG